MARVGSKGIALSVVEAIEKERPRDASDGEGGVAVAPASPILLNAGHVALVVGFEFQHGKKGTAPMNARSKGNGQSE